MMKENKDWFEKALSEPDMHEEFQPVAEWMELVRYARRWKYPLVNLKEFTVGADLIGIAPVDFWVANSVLPIHLGDGVVTIAIANMNIENVADAVRKLSGLAVEVCICSPKALKNKINEIVGHNEG